MHNYCIANRLLTWIKTHKFWMSTILLLLITITVRFCGPSISIGDLEISYLFFGGLLYFYTIIGGLIWAGLTRKFGMTMITIGILSAIYSVFLWAVILINWDFEVTRLSMAIIFAFISILFLYFGNKRYKQWKLQQHEDNK
ncbi:MAG: hypothetical protein PHF74_07590 [Dehalococcoidales bacterium]|nr:hypothetical protein [Dehalococcoidales bacterium]